MGSTWETPVSTVVGPTRCPLELRDARNTADQRADSGEAEVQLRPASTAAWPAATVALAASCVCVSLSSRLAWDGAAWDCGNVAQVHAGNLVGPTTVLTGVSQVDPIKVDFPISADEYLRIAARSVPRR